MYSLLPSCVVAWCWVMKSSWGESGGVRKKAKAKKELQLILISLTFSLLFSDDNEHTPKARCAQTSNLWKRSKMVAKDTTLFDTKPCLLLSRILYRPALMPLAFGLLFSFSFSSSSSFLFRSAWNSSQLPFPSFSFSAHIRSLTDS